MSLSLVSVYLVDLIPLIYLLYIMYGSPSHVSMAYLLESFTTLLDLMIDRANLLSQVTTGGHLLLGVKSVGSQQY